MKVLLRVQIKKKVVKKYRKQRETSSDEVDIPLMELAKRMQEKDRADKLGMIILQ